MGAKINSLEEDIGRQNFRSRIASAAGLFLSVPAIPTLMHENSLGKVGLIVGTTLAVYSATRILRAWDLGYYRDIVEDVIEEKVIAGDS